MDKKDLPIHFTRDSEPKWALIHIGVGALLGVIAGALLTYHDKIMTENILNQCNQKVVETYHPEFPDV